MNKIINSEKNKKLAKKKNYEKNFKTDENYGNLNEKRFLEKIEKKLMKIKMIKKEKKEDVFK